MAKDNNGEALRSIMQQYGLSTTALSGLCSVNIRTVRNWIGSPSKRCQAVPAWVIPDIISRMSRIRVVDNFIIGKSLSGIYKDAVYLIHTQKPAFCCMVSSSDKPGDRRYGMEYAVGDHVFHNFVFFDGNRDQLDDILVNAAPLLEKQLTFKEIKE